MATAQYGSLPFKEQIAFFRSKKRVPTQRWNDLTREQHDAGFMVANATAADLLADLHSAVDKAIAKGTTFAEFQKDFESIVAKHGWTGWRGEDTPAGRAWRARLIYDTNLRTSYQAGRWAQVQEVKATRPYLIYRHSDAVSHPRPLHVSWDGLVVRTDDPWVKAHWPPNGWGCFTGETRVRCNARIGLKTSYSGEMVELHTALGNTLTATVNHPVLTGNGWMAAGDLQKGNELIGACGNIDSMVHGIVDDEQTPGSAKDLFESLAAQGLRIVPMSPDDFHGDANLRKPEIHVACSNSALMDEIQAAINTRIGENGLDGALHGRVKTTGDAICPTETLSIKGHTVFSQDSSYGRLGKSEALGDLRLTAETATIERQHSPLGVVVSGVRYLPGPTKLSLNTTWRALDGLPAQDGRISPSANIDTSKRQGAPKSGPAASDLFSQLLKANAGLIARDEVVQIRKFYGSHDVYDFVTSTGLILAGGVVVSNCQCRMYSLSDQDLKKMGKSGPDTPPEDGTYEWTDKKTGEIHTFPNGIDPFWDYAPGASRVETIRREIERKAESWPKAIAQQVVADIEKEVDALNIGDVHEAAVRYVAENGKKQERNRIEFAYVYDADGNVLVQKRGGKSMVEFDQAEMDTMRNAQGAVLVHNHPRGTSLSDADFRMSLLIDGDVYAIGHNGVNYRGKTLTANVRELSNAMSVLEGFLRSRILSLIIGKTISIEEADFANAHFVNELLKRKGLVEYEIADGNDLIEKIPESLRSILKEGLDKIDNGML